MYAGFEDVWTFLYVFRSVKEHIATFFSYGGLVHLNFIHCVIVIDYVLVIFS